MHKLWQVINAAQAQSVVADFKVKDELWRAIPFDSNHDDTDLVLALNQQHGYYSSFNPYCLVEPIGVDMNKLKPI